MMGDLHLLPGTTFSSIRDRGEYKPAKMASLTMRELERWLTLQIVEIYHQRVHRSIGEPPIKAWEKTLASGQVTIRHSLLGQCHQSVRRPLDRPESDSLRSTGPFACLYKSHFQRPQEIRRKLNICRKHFDCQIKPQRKCRRRIF